MRTYHFDVVPSKPAKFDEGLVMHIEIPASNRAQAVRRIWRYIPTGLIVGSVTATKRRLKAAIVASKCKSADRYKGLRAPTCNKGRGCDVCKDVFATAQRKRLEAACDEFKDSMPILTGLVRLGYGLK